MLHWLHTPGATDLDEPRVRAKQNRITRLSSDLLAVSFLPLRVVAKEKLASLESVVVRARLCRTEHDDQLDWEEFGTADVPMKIVKATRLVLEQQRSRSRLSGRGTAKPIAFPVDVE